MLLLLFGNQAEIVEPDPDPDLFEVRRAATVDIDR
jgi:hypothetical protein